MNPKTNITEWKHYFYDRGIDHEVVPIYLKYVDTLNKNNVPVIFEIEHLASLLGLKLSILIKMVNSTESFYRCFKIPKKRGGFREIQAPYPSLLEAQKWIYKNILLRTEVHESVHGFVRSKSIFSNASNHLSKNSLLKIDIKDFFPSIQKNWIIQFFLSLGYAPNVSFYLASLCCLNEHLVQGAASSPYLSNIICRHMDNRLSLLADSINATYTRYADDMAISGDYLSQNFVGLAKIIIAECGFEVNKEKTYLSTGKGKRILTGLSVAQDKISLPRDYKRKLRLEVHYVIKYGYLSHTSKMKIRNPFYLDSLLGKLLFWQQAEPENGLVNNYISKLKEIKIINQAQ